MIFPQNQSLDLHDIHDNFSISLSFSLASFLKSNVSISKERISNSLIQLPLNYYNQYSSNNTFTVQWHQIIFKKEPNHSNMKYVNINISFNDFYFLLFLIFTLSKSKQMKKRKSRYFLVFLFSSLLNLILSHQGFLKVQSILMNCDKTVFFSIETLNAINKVQNEFLSRNQRLFSIFLSENRFNHKSITLRYSTFLKLLLILSGNVELNPGPNHNIADSNQWDVFSKRGLHLLHLNINSLLPKIDELRSIAKQCNAAVIGISESKLDFTVCDSEISIDGYDIIRNDRDRRGGGVACFVKNTICYNQNFMFQNDVENIIIDLIFPNTKPITVGIFYRPPDQRNFIESISQEFPSLNLESNEVYLLGDFNYNLYQNEKHIFKNFSKSTINVNAEIRNYIEFCSLFGLEQIIETPTRITCNSSSIIDHILTNSSEIISQSGVIDTGISDHQLIFCTRKKSKIKVNDHKQITFRCFKNYSEKTFDEALEKISFPDYEIFLDIDTAYKDFFSKLSEVVNKMAPEKTKRLKNSTQEWYDGEIIDAMSDRDELLKKFKTSRLHVDQINYNNTRISVQNLIKKKKEEFFRSKLEQNRNKPKELWTSLKSLGMPNEKKSSSNICLEQNGNTFFESSKIAEVFADFFSNLANELVAKLPKASNRFGLESVRLYYREFSIGIRKLIFTHISPEDILILLQNIEPNKAAGIDKISGKFFKHGAKRLATPIAQLCNLSIILGTFPDECKIAKLIPLYKKGSKVDPKNYRPISLLPIVSKIIEKVIYDQTINFLKDRNFLYDFQSGFRKNHSTDSCLTYLNNKIVRGFDSGLFTGMILIDLQKAFDTIDHKILLNKMKYFGFSQQVIKWFSSYLADRKFRTCINNTFSESYALTCGVPQGSILGPLLFLLYVNDMPQAINCELLLYADDSCLVYQHKEVEVIERQLNENFSNICEWFLDNKLSIHFGEDKTKSILFATKHRLKQVSPLHIKYHDINIKQHSKVTYLGCIFDESLSGESMALKVINKINGRLKFLYRKNRFLSFPLRRLLCNALIQPHFDYACCSWYSNLNKKLKDKLQVLQNKCIRFCLHLGNRDHIGIEEFQAINWLPVNDRFLQQVASNAFKFFHSTCPKYMSELFDATNESHIVTRSSLLKLKLPFCKTSKGQTSPSYMIPKVWNNLPQKLKLSKTVDGFKQDFKRYFLKVGRKPEAQKIRHLS